MPAVELNSVADLINSANLKAYYRFESGALTTDSSGEGHTLTAISDPAEDASGQFGGAVAFDGNDAYSAVNHADFRPTGNFTIGLWVKMSDTTASYKDLFTSYDIDSSVYAGIELGLTNQHKPYLSSYKNTGTSNGTDYKEVIATTAINDNTWRFIVGTWDGSYLRIYINGIQEGGNVAWANAPAYKATNYVRIGCRYYSASNNAFFTGSLDDVFLFNGTALSADQIQSIYDGTINSPSSSISASPSSSLSTSPSLSPSSSVSLSPSSSISSSLSSSISSSPSPSTSPSTSISSSLSSSVSTSPSVGWTNYTKADSVSLPANDADLANNYTEQNIIDVSTSNDVRVSQSGTDYVIHQFKDYIGAASSVSLTWEGQTNESPSLSPVLLQIYNRNTTTWDTVDTDSTSPADTDFILSGNVDVDNYKDASNVISCRVYQQLA